MADRESALSIGLLPFLHTSKAEPDKVLAETAVCLKTFSTSFIIQVST
ncbi:MAG: hypothetical protein AB1394_03040 [Bacteroidota bacterium]